MTFEDLNLNKPLQNALNDLGYKNPTSIQQKAFPAIMSGKDVVGIAQTGTGKTMAYLLPCLRMLEFSKEHSPRILILVPTRELVAQVVREAHKLTGYMNIKVAGFYGGANIKPQQEILSEGIDLVIATPGRLLDFALNGSLHTKAINKLVIDEMDEMLDLGFRPQLSRILDLLPQKRQNLLFSATITEEVEKLIAEFFNEPKKIEAAPSGTPLEQISQTCFLVPNFYTKVNLLVHLLEDDAYSKVLVFVASKQIADDLYTEIKNKFPEQIAVIHSNKSQNNRFESVKKFQSNQNRILIATDIVARGLDVAEVSHVVNFDMPELPETYIHRMGRTGRVDKTGISIGFVRPSEMNFVEEIESLMQIKIGLQDTLPEKVEVTDVLREDEMLKVKIPVKRLKEPKKENVGAAFHEKSAKNQKVNVRRSHLKEKIEKYGKPIRRGAKKGNKK